MTVNGPVPYYELGITDAHNHVWIEPIIGIDPSSPVLNRYSSIANELRDYRRHGGKSILDCQPYGCGRNGNQLLALSATSDVNIIACSGFHRKQYYPPEFWIWKSNAGKIADFICSEISIGFEETNAFTPVKAGFIKIALEAVWQKCPLELLEGAAEAADRSQALIEIHTEKGELAEKIVRYFSDRGVSPVQLVLCHMDKKNDPELHKDLAKEGVMLEYDTFFRKKYEPEKNLWSLLESMIEAGHSANVALATDMAEPVYYRYLENGPGLASLPEEIQVQLIQRGFDKAVRSQLLGENIARRLAGIT